MVASSSQIDSTKKSLYPISVTTLEWSISLLCLLENCGHPLLWMLCLLVAKVIFKLAKTRLLSLWKQSINEKNQPCCICGIKDCNLSSFCQPCKDILQSLFTNLARFNFSTYRIFTSSRILIPSGLLWSKNWWSRSSLSLPSLVPWMVLGKIPLGNWGSPVPDSPIVAQIEHLGLHANPVKIPECSVACVFLFQGN